MQPAFGSSRSRSVIEDETARPGSTGCGGCRRSSTAVWVAVGVAGAGAYLLSTLDAGTRWAFAMLLGASVVVAVLVGRLPLLQPEDPGRFTRPEGSARRRSVLPVAVGLVGGLLAV